MKERSLTGRQRACLLTIQSMASVLVLIVLLLPASGLAQVYSEDLDDIAKGQIPGGFQAIGDLGQIESVLDLRGFIPFSYMSNRRTKSVTFSDIVTFSRNTDVYAWYKYPTIEGVAVIYYGSDDDVNVERVKRARITDEHGLLEEERYWVDLAYKLAIESGEDLFKAVGRRSGFESAEPIVVLLTRNSAILVINFRYSTIDRRGTGQVLAAFEFSRALRKAKTYYQVNTTMWLGRSASDAFSSALPLILKILSSSPAQ